MAEAALPTTPYKGLIPYDERDAPFFFGRKPDQEIITANLTARRLTLLYGPSGVGKSSVLRAGVEHHLHQQAQQNLMKRGAPELAVVVFSEWRDDPMARLKAQIQQAVTQSLNGHPLESPAPPTMQSGDFIEFLKTSSALLADRDSAPSRGQLSGRLLIIFDQFEEYFLYHSQEDGAGTFAAEFPRAVNDPDLPISFLVSTREDALAKLDRFEGRIPNLFDNYLRIEHLDRDAGQEAIEKPILEYNRRAASDQPVRIESSLVDAVLDQVKTGKIGIGEIGRGDLAADVTAETEAQIETPFLQLVMTRLWQEEMRLGSRVLRTETLYRLGGAKRIVETHLDQAMNELSSEEQRTASFIFQHLVTRSRTKIAYPVLDLAEEYRLEPQQILSVVDKLSSGENRILRPVASPLDQPELLRYEIFHDVLSNAILDWRTRYVQKQRQAEAEQMAEEERQRAEKHVRIANERERTAKILRRLLAALIVLLLIAIVAFSLAMRERMKANLAKKDAEQSEIIFAGLALANESLYEGVYLYNLRDSDHLFVKYRDRLRNILVVDSEGSIIDSLDRSDIGQRFSEAEFKEGKSHLFVVETEKGTRRIFVVAN